tara:strand:+ start:275 stop:484 length:210 start_codon:yes stop_codon:yes gene_type:complete
MMTITRTDPITGRTNFLGLDITEEQLRSWHNGELIQDAMPNLTADEREFIMTGITSDSWKFLFLGDKEN